MGTGLRALPISPWAGIGVLAAWTTGAMLAGGLLLQFAIPAAWYAAPLWRRDGLTGPNRWLMLSTPSGFENLIRETGIPAKALTLPPPGQVPAAANEKVSWRFGITCLPTVV